LTLYRKLAREDSGSHRKSSPEHQSERLLQPV
jgi:hypothetical protein